MSYKYQVSCAASLIRGSAESDFAPETAHAPADLRGCLTVMVLSVTVADLADLRAPRDGRRSGHADERMLSGTLTR
jgi:hypothetical protein